MDGLEIRDLGNNKIYKVEKRGVERNESIIIVCKSL